MIDLANQQGLSPKEAAILLPSYKGGKPSHPSKIIRLITKGTRLPNGSVERLEALRIGNQWITTAEAIRTYGERVAAGSLGQPQSIATKPISPRPAAERADRELASIGI